MKGDIDGGLALFDEGHNVLVRMNLKFSDTYFLSLRSRILDLGRRGDEALATIDEVLAMAQSSDEKIGFADFLRLRGDFLIRYRGAEAEAEREFRKALAIARKQKALTFELRISQSLANLMRSRGDEAGALHLLEPVFDRFTEGFDTADLISARKTIDELKSRTRACRIVWHDRTP